MWPHFSFLPPFHMLKYMCIKQKHQWSSLFSKHRTLFPKLSLCFILQFSWCTEKTLEYFLIHEEFHDSVSGKLFYLNEKQIWWFSCKNKCVHVLFSESVLIPFTGKFYQKHSSIQNIKSTVISNITKIYFVSFYQMLVVPHIM